MNNDTQTTSPRTTPPTGCVRSHATTRGVFVSCGPTCTGNPHSAAENTRTWNERAVEKHKRDAQVSCPACGHTFENPIIKRYNG
jgi:hypothetical protein